MADADDLWTALDDALAIIQEWGEADFDEKLRRLGLSPEAVREVSEQRWEAYQADLGRTDQERFAQAFVEGLIIGVKLQRKARVD